MLFIADRASDTSFCIEITPISFLHSGLSLMSHNE